MKCIVYTRPDGGVSVIHPAPQARFADEAEDEFIARIMAKDVPADAKHVCVCDHAELPDRAHRNAWRQNGKGPPVVGAPARQTT